MRSEFVTAAVLRLPNKHRSIERLKGYTTMALEWSVYDSAKTPVWVDSFRAELKGPITGVEGRKRIIQRRMDIILEDLFKQSRLAFLSSPEIREFAESVSRPAAKE